MLHAGLDHPAKAGQPVTDDARAGRDVGSRVIFDSFLGEARNAAQLSVDRLVLTGCDGDDERDFVGSPTPDFAGLLTAEVGVVDLHLAPNLVGGVALAHDLHQLLLDEPGSVPLDAELAGKLERGDVVLGAGEEMDREEPLDQRRARFVEHGAGACRSLHAAGRALENAPRRRIAVLTALAMRNTKPSGQRMAMRAAWHCSSVPYRRLNSIRLSPFWNCTGLRAIAVSSRRQQPAS